MHPAAAQPARAANLGTVVQSPGTNVKHYQVNSGATPKIPLLLEGGSYEVDCQFMTPAIYVQEATETEEVMRGDMPCFLPK